MSRGAVLWERALARHQGLEKALADDSKVESSAADLVADDPFAGFKSDFESSDEPTADDRLKELENFNSDINLEAPESAANDKRNKGSTNVGTPVPVVDTNFEDSVDLWLTRSHVGLEHALLLMGLTRDVFPTKRPLLVFRSRRTGLTVPEYHRVEVKREGWSSRLYSTERLTGNAAAEILASSVDETTSSSDPTCFEGETVAAEVPNPLLADDRWIVIWPKLESLPERAQEETATESAELHQWRQVRRVVWCVNREQIGPRDVLEWLPRFWQGIPLRIALFRVSSFVDEKKDMAAQSKALPGVRRTLEKFAVIKGHPWIVVGP